jgi:hypothetical protein
MKSPDSHSGFVINTFPSHLRLALSCGLLLGIKLKQDWEADCVEVEILSLILEILET